MRREENLIAGTGISLTPSDNASTGQQDVTISNSGDVGPTTFGNTSLTSLSSSSVIDVGSVSLTAPAGGFVLLSIVFNVQLLNNPANSGYIFNFGYGTSGSTFSDDDTGTIYQDPSDANESTFSYTQRIGVGAGSNTFHALFQVTSGTTPPASGTAKVKARITAQFVGS